MTAPDKQAFVERVRGVAARGDGASAILALTAANRARPDGDFERELLRLRHGAFRALGNGRATLRAPIEPSALPATRSGAIPEVTGTPSPTQVRTAIEHHGSLIVRGLLNPDQTACLKATVETAIAAREQKLDRATASAWYSEFEPIGHAGARAFTSEAGLLAADSPRGMFQLLEIYREAGIDRLAAGVLGSRPVVSVEKSVFRRVHPEKYATWHQDGAFLGERINTLDVWIALSPCGRTAPGLEIVARRVDRVLPTGCFFDWDLSDQTLDRECPGNTRVMPEFAPGDAMFFDQLCVHRSGHAPGMTDPRLAVECWLFGAENVPPKYTGLLL